MIPQLALLPGYLTAHLQLSLIALALGIGFSVPLGVALTRLPRFERPALAVASVIQTIPSLALLAIMVPALAALGLRSIGFLPAIIGLTLYSILPVLRNTVIGLQGVDRTLIEAADGVGMTGAQRLWRIELPLALPVIVAGIRTATVWTVGMATLATPIGATSLGNYIFSGLQTRNYDAVLLGCVASAGLALLLDGLVRLLETGLRERRRARSWLALGIFALLYLYTGATLLPGLTGARAERPIVIGAKTFTEQYILADILAGQISRATGAPTRIVSSLGSTVAFDALGSGQIDAYVEYSGTIWATLMKRDDVLDRDTVLREVGDWLQTQHGIALVAALGFENSYALAMRGSEARRLDISDLSQLAPTAPRLTIGGDYEFFARPEWRAIQSAYGLAFKDQRILDTSLMYQAAAQGEVDVISAFSTDGRIAGFDLTVLADDRHAIPPYDAIILAGPALARDHPAALAALRNLAGSIDAPRMRAMNAEVDHDHVTPEAVAAQFL
ncbi:MAG TPA: ABC transporter permease/substrate-binding protein [Stellaceae bacterium]|nr:ABC transporter permease/substrate-binding protein [Stellaceae bacterium]